MTAVKYEDSDPYSALLLSLKKAHKNLTAEEQANEVRRVKKFESGMVINPITIQPDAKLADAYALMDLASGAEALSAGAREAARLARDAIDALVTERGRLSPADRDALGALTARGAAS